MYGFSVFLNEQISDAALSEMEKKVRGGFQGIFTSIHIPEDDHSKYLAGLQKLGTFAKKRRIELMVDISGSALQRLGFSYDDVTPLQELGLTGIRMDYGIPMKIIAQISQQMDVALNASTITEKDLEELQNYGADFNRMEAWHNYYPRPETGLGKESFCQQNIWLKEAGFTVMAFVPGDKKRRGPLFEGLPTLEKHRGIHPLAAALELTKDCHVDKVYIGDPGIQETTLEQFSSYIQMQTMHLIAIPEPQSVYLNRLEGKHMNRLDDARDVMRSAEARMQSPDRVKAENAMERPIGSITIDNEKYGRYMGEIQITKRDLPVDERVNVIGRVRKEEIPLLAYCGPGQFFQIDWLKGDKTNGFG